jgi:membrane protease YdiL (CAAX protease family)
MASGLLLVLLALPSLLLQRLLAKPLLQSLSLLQQLLLMLLLLLRLIAGPGTAGYALMSPVLLARAKL